MGRERRRVMEREGFMVVVVAGGYFVWDGVGMATGDLGAGKKKKKREGSDEDLNDGRVKHRR